IADFDVTMCHLKLARRERDAETRRAVEAHEQEGNHGDHGHRNNDHERTLHSDTSRSAPPSTRNRRFSGACPSTLAKATGSFSIRSPSSPSDVIAVSVAVAPSRAARSASSGASLTSTNPSLWVVGTSA